LKAIFVTLESTCLIGYCCLVPNVKNLTVEWAVNYFNLLARVHNVNLKAEVKEMPLCVILHDEWDVGWEYLGDLNRQDIFDYVEAIAADSGDDDEIKY
jgi:hypothetical protein